LDPEVPKCSEARRNDVAVSEMTSGVVARYLDPRTDTVIEARISEADDVATVVRDAQTLASGRGRPAVDFQRGDGSTLTYASDGDRAALVWIDPLGEPFHSLGGNEGDVLVYDYFGSWSEVPAEYTVTESVAIRCLANYVALGAPGVDVLFDPG